jgi:hypothetical protein
MRRMSKNGSSPDGIGARLTPGGAVAEAPDLLGCAAYYRRSLELN